MSEDLRRIIAYTVPETKVVEGFPDMPPYLRVVGMAAPGGPTSWDERAGKEQYAPAVDARLPGGPVDHSPPPPEAGEVRRVRKSTLSLEDVTEEDRRLAERAFSEARILFSDQVVFRDVAKRIKQGNCCAERPATYQEALHALELARLFGADKFEYRIACFELTLFAAIYCHYKKLSVRCYIGVSVIDDTFHAWLQADGQPVRGEADEVVTGAYKKLWEIQ